MNLIKNGFSKLGISNNILNALKKLNFKEPTPIQKECIPIMMQKKDIIGQAHTGTGKTAALGIPILENINTESKEIQAILLCPTRELAQQVARQLEEIGYYINNLKIAHLIGGLPIEKQIKTLKKKPQIIVGTPGRIVDHIKRKTLKLENANSLIIDEADEMLNMGFREELEFILKKITNNHQTALFSATIPKSIQKLALQYQKNPINIKVSPSNSTANNIKQYYYKTLSNKKVELLIRLLDIKNPLSSIVFCNTKKRVDLTTKYLKEYGYLAKTLHGDIEQKKRDQIMQDFRDHGFTILVATDVASRGVDVKGVEAIFNFDLPIDCQSYIHRIGRTGRANMSGNSYAFITNNEEYLIKKFQTITKNNILQCNFPDNKYAEKARAIILFNEVNKLLKTNSLNKYKEIIKEQLKINKNNCIVNLSAAILKRALPERDKNITIELPEDIYKKRQYNKLKKYKFNRSSNSKKKFNSERKNRSYNKLNTKKTNNFKQQKHHNIKH